MRRAGLLASGTPLEEASPQEVTLAKELSEELGGLPLALDQAGAYIDAAACGLKDYLQLYRTRRAVLLKERGDSVQDHPKSVATTLSLSIHNVEQFNQAASDLLRLCAFLQPDAIAEEILMEGAEYLGPQLQAIASDPLAMNKAITALRKYSLISRDSTTHTLTIHRLVQAVLKDTMDQPTSQQWIQRAVAVLNAVFPEPTYEVWSRCERLTPHVLMYASSDIDRVHEQELASLLRKTANYLRERARYEQPGHWAARPVRPHQGTD